MKCNIFLWEGYYSPFFQYHGVSTPLVRMRGAKQIRFDIIYYTGNYEYYRWPIKIRLAHDLSYVTLPKLRS